MPTTPAGGLFIKDVCVFQVDISVCGDLEICGLPVMSTARVKWRIVTELDSDLVKLAK